MCLAGKEKEFQNIFLCHVAFLVMSWFPHGPCLQLVQGFQFAFFLSLMLGFHVICLLNH